jgi:hypothetical protein
MDFADALHLARSEGCGALISFDRQLALLAGQLNLQPAVRRPRSSDVLESVRFVRNAGAQDRRVPGRAELPYKLTISTELLEAAATQPGRSGT